RGHRPVDERGVSAPAVRVAVCVLLGLDERSRGPELLDDGCIGVEDVHPGELVDFGGESPAIVDRAQHWYPDRLAGPLVLLTEPGRHLHDARALISRDEVLAEDHEGAGRVGEEREEGAKVASDEVGSGNGAEDLEIAENLLVSRETSQAD